MRGLPRRGKPPIPVEIVEALRSQGLQVIVHIMSAVPVPLSDQITGVIEVVSTGLDVTGAGRVVVGAFVHRHMEAIREQLTSDAEAGKIGAINLYDNPNVGGYIFRLTAAVRQGVRAKNIRLLARYFFGEASRRQLDYDACVEDATIIESLTDSEMRCLAIYKSAIDSGRLWLRSRETEDWRTGIHRDDEPMRYTTNGIDLMGLFPSESAFSDAAVTLQRWGLVRPSLTLDASGCEPTDKLPAFMSRLDLDGIIDL